MERYEINVMSNDSTGKKLGFWSLTAIVFGMVVGSGLYNIPQNLAIGAGPLGTAIAWMITAAGMLFLVGTFKILADSRPDLDAGIYQYTQEGFGNYAGFNIAWGYWLCIAFANIAYAIMLNDSFGAFIPSLQAHGWQTLVFCTALIWVMFFIVCRGIKTARLINNLMAVVKIAAIILVVILLILNARYGVFTADLFASGLKGEGLLEQVKNCMVVTLWCFVGIEGAVMMAARAKKPEDVGRAGVTGFIIAWLLYFLVSMLCYGVMARAELAGLSDPSVAYLLKVICGDWAYYFVVISIIISLLGGWLAWTLVCAQVPYEAAVVRIFPQSFMKLNMEGMPRFGLLVSSVAMEAFLFIVLMADDVYLMALNIASVMVLPAYLMSGVFLLKLSCREAGRNEWRKKLVGGGCCLYCIWLIYAAGLDLMAYTSVFYIAGRGFYLKSRKERRRHVPLRPSISDIVTILLLSAGAITTLCLICK
ncbi:MAG: basic amino acid/polyamine antiporter [Muribaculaceae bacterium]|nr:basic amino acid/polyamine antiporter [Muribaculaceae bacterium]